MIIDDNTFSIFYKDGNIKFCNLNDKECYDPIFTSSEKFNEINSIEKMKDGSKRLVTCDGKKIKIWDYFYKNKKIELQNQLIIICGEEETIKTFPLNNSSNIASITENDVLKIYNNEGRKFFNLTFKNITIRDFYQIESNDENNNLLIIFSRDYMLFMKNYDIRTIKQMLIGTEKNESIFYNGKNKLFIGNDNELWIVDIKNQTFEKVFKSFYSFKCFYPLKDRKVLCGLGDTSSCHMWSRGVPFTEITKFAIIEFCENDYKIKYFDDKISNYGIINMVKINENKFLSAFTYGYDVKIFIINE